MPDKNCYLDPDAYDKIILASRHVATLHWLERTHPELSAKLHYDPAVRRRDISRDVAVIGSWPIHLLEESGAFFVIEFQQKPKSSDMSADDMVACGAYLRRVHVHDDTTLQLLIDFARDNPDLDAQQVTAAMRAEV